MSNQAHKIKKKHRIRLHIESKFLNQSLIIISADVSEPDRKTQQLSREHTTFFPSFKLMGDFFKKKNIEKETKNPPQTFLRLEYVIFETSTVSDYFWTTQSAP